MAVFPLDVARDHRYEFVCRAYIQNSSSLHEEKKWNPHQPLADSQKILLRETGSFLTTLLLRMKISLLRINDILDSVVLVH